MQDKVEKRFVNLAWPNKVSFLIFDIIINNFIKVSSQIRSFLIQVY